MRSNKDYSSSPHCAGLEVLPAESSEQASGECTAWRVGKTDSTLTAAGRDLGVCMCSAKGRPQICSERGWVWRIQAGDV